jgi:NAD(P)-dependent dehydrogenase (short-subunit alcohol dehydrogenase family)
MIREILVVIGTGGMGATIARRAGIGRRVVLADRDPDALQAVVETMAAEGFDVSPCVVDVTDSSSVTELAAQAFRSGPVTAVVHTAGVSPTHASVEAIVRVDLLGTAHVLDAFADVMAAYGSGVITASMAGTIFAGGLSAEYEHQLASTPASELLETPVVRALLDAGDSPDARSTAYGIAKRGNQLRVRAAASRWGARGARVNSIGPGVISTAMGRAELADPATGDMVSGMVVSSPAGRVGTAADISAVAEFLLSNAAGFVTGTDLLVDGGVCAAMLTPQLREPASSLT